MSPGVSSTGSNACIDVRPDLDAAGQRQILVRCRQGALSGLDLPSIVFGPVPSRRLGRSLGINNVLPKECTYSCVYCQLGRTCRLHAKRRRQHPPGAVREAVEQRVRQARQTGERIDALTFVPDGEPTLDVELGREIQGIRALGLRIAVISNGSLVHRQDVRHDLGAADWVSLKVDAVDEPTWRRINRPHRSLDLDGILRGMLRFQADFGGVLVTETMLAAGLNDDPGHLETLGEFLQDLAPAIAYLAIPTRAPAERWVHPPDEETLNTAYQILGRRLPRVELLVAYEGSAFAVSGSSEDDLLSITAVHPLRAEAVADLLRRNGDDWTVVDRLLRQGRLVLERYQNESFYLRRFRPAPADSGKGPGGGGGFVA
jgi:wyosine [tRNA(Phe)-imidazoG37] synthetase (radical SAM superfamily)